MEKVINMIQTIDEWARKEPQRPVYLTEEKVSTYGVSDCRIRRIRF